MKYNVLKTKFLFMYSYNTIAFFKQPDKKYKHNFYHFIALLTSFVTLCVTLRRIFTGSLSLNFGELPTYINIIQNLRLS